MKHGFSPSILVLLIILSFFFVDCHDEQQKSRFEKIKEVVAKNMHILGPMLTQGPSEKMVDFYLKVQFHIPI